MSQNDGLISTLTKKSSFYFPSTVGVCTLCITYYACCVCREGRVECVYGRPLVLSVQKVHTLLLGLFVIFFCASRMQDSVVSARCLKRKWAAAGGCASNGLVRIHIGFAHNALREFAIETGFQNACGWLWIFHETGLWRVSKEIDLMSKFHVGQR